MILEDRSVEKRRMGDSTVEVDVGLWVRGLEIMESEIEEVGGGGEGHAL